MIPPQLAGDVPVVPDPDQARDWLDQELASPEYAAAQPTWFDLLVQRFLDWLGGFSLDSSGAEGFPWWVLVLIAIAVIIAIAVFRVVGLPRLQHRRSAQRGLFGDDDERDAATLRQAARRAALSGEWATAIAELYRALARDLDDRTLVTLLPGTTAHGFARQASMVFPAESSALEASAGDFDRVRYLGEPGSREDYQRLSELDQRVRAARPLLAETLA